MADFSSVGGTQVYGPPDVTKIANFSDAGGSSVDAYNQALRDIPKPQVNVQPVESDEIRNEYGDQSNKPGDVTNLAKGVVKAVANQVLDLGKVSVPSALRYPTTLQKSPQEQAAFDKARLAYIPRGTAQQVGSTTVNAASATLPIADVPNAIAEIPNLARSAYNFAKEALGANPEALEALVKAADVGKAFEEKPTLPPIHPYTPPVQSPESEEMLAGVGRAVGQNPAFNPEAAERMRMNGGEFLHPQSTAENVFPLQRANLLGHTDSTLADVDFIASAKRHGVDEDTIDELLAQRDAQRDRIRKANSDQAAAVHGEALSEDAQRSMEPAQAENTAREQQRVVKGVAAGQQKAAQAVENQKLNAELAATPNVPTFYSKAENVATAKLPGSGSGDSMLATLKNNGVKPDEADWMDLEGFLKGKPKVTKQEVVDYIRNNGINLRETDLSQPDKTAYETAYARHDEAWQRATNLETKLDATDHQLFAKVFDYTRHPGEGGIDEILKGATSPESEALAREYLKARSDSDAAAIELNKAEDAVANHPAQVRHSQYVLNGEHTNYREKLFNLAQPALDPVKADSMKLASSKVKELNKQSESIRNSINDLENSMRAKGNAEYIDTAEYVQDEERRSQLYQEQKKLNRELHIQQKLAAPPGPLYQAPSGHYPGEQGSNLLAHARFDDRQLENGDKALMIEEIQSDWHQAGREEGYQTADVEKLHKTFQDAERKVAELEKRWHETREKPEYMGWSSKQMYNLPEWKEYRQAALESEYAREEYGRSAKGVANAPLKHSWHEMVLKRMLREAAEKGYDRLAWTTGEQQARRWNSLLENVGRIEYNPKAGEVIVFDKNGRQIGTESAGNQKELERVVGHDMAEDLWKQSENYEGDGRSSNPNPNNLPTLEQAQEYAYEQARDNYNVEEYETEPEEEGGEPETRYRVVDSNGETISDHSTERQANRAMDEYVDSDADVYMQDTDYYDPDNEEEQESDLPSVEGDGITIGAHGHSGFYDKIMGDFLRKYVKKWDTTVEDMPLQHPDNEGRKQVVHTIKITPKMRKSVLKEGQPIAQNRQEEAPKVSPYASAQEALG